jgi:hypothetical protein
VKKETKEVDMEIILLPAVIVGVWLILSHIRRQQLLKDYMEIQNKALDKGVTLPDDLNALATAKTDWAAVTLRVGIISLILGIVGVIIGLVILPNQPGMLEDRDATEALAVFWAFGMLLAAFGVGNLICWFLIDRRRGDKTGKGE